MKALTGSGLFRGTVLFLTLLSATGFTFGQIPVSVELKPTNFPIQINEYFIHQIISELDESRTLGTVIRSSKNLIENHNVTLKGGLQKGLTNFFNDGFTRKNGHRPIVVRLKVFKIFESIQPAGLINGRVDVTISYEILRNSNPLKLVEYKGGSRYTRSITQENVIETVMNKTLINALLYFDKWMNREVSVNEKLAENVSISFHELERQQPMDTLFYSPGRKLKWSDFKSRPDAKSQFAAEIFPFFSFDESSRIVNGEIKVNLNLKVYLVRTFSWVKNFAQNTYTLNHEQRHFDIVKIAAEKFKENIRKEELTVDNYQGIISFEYLESLREMNRMQLKYDQETKHGTNPLQQARWDRIIEEQLRSEI